MAATSARRVAAFTALWRALRRGIQPGSPGIVDRLKALPRMIALTLTGRYPHLGYGRLAAMALAVAYVVSPVDLVPEVVLPLLGIGDDAFVLAWLAGALLNETERFVAWDGQRAGSAVFDTPGGWTKAAPADQRTVVGDVVR